VRSAILSAYSVDGVKLVIHLEIEGCVSLRFYRIVEPGVCLGGPAEKL
jgi:hypothetical protein